MPDAYVVPPLEHRREAGRAEALLDLADITASLRSLMVRRMGISRDRDGLREAEKQVSFWCRYVLPRTFDSRGGSEMQNMLLVARLMIWGALKREESRGVHSRTDFPARDDANWQRRLPCPAALD